MWSYYVLEIVKSYKHHGFHIDDKLSWGQCTNAIYRKAQRRMYFLRTFLKPTTQFPYCLISLSQRVSCRTALYVGLIEEQTGVQNRMGATS